MYSEWCCLLVLRDSVVSWAQIRVVWYTSFKWRYGMALWISKLLKIPRIILPAALTVISNIGSVFGLCLRRWPTIRPALSLCSGVFWVNRSWMTHYFPLFPSTKISSPLSAWCLLLLFVKHHRGRSDFDIWCSDLIIDKPLGSEQMSVDRFAL